MAAPPTAPTRSVPGRAELLTMLSMIMAATALGVDLMLPAFGEMRAEFGLAADSNVVAGVITAYILGLALSQLFYGPIADRFGRKPTLYAGLALYVVGAGLSALAPSIEVLFAARFLWGIGAAGPRVITLSVVRDTYQGDRMSRAMSFVFAIFILVPVVAPSIGAAIVAVLPWRWVFGFCVLFALGVAVWAQRLPETLRPEHRRELRLRPILRAGREVVSNRVTLGYMLSLTFLFGGFLSYLASSEVIVSETFGRGEVFPLVFGGLAATMGVAMLVNARIVEGLGARKLLHAVLFVYVGVALVLAAVAIASGGRPPFWWFLAGMAVMLFCHALLMPNLNSVAMDPMGEIAGTASAVIGTVSTAVGALLGSFLDRAFDGTVTPIALGFAGYGILALTMVLWAERGHLFPAPQPG